MKHFLPLSIFFLIFSNAFSQGNVGVGTATPTAKLDVLGPATGSGVTIKAGGGGDVMLNTGGSIFFDGNYSYGAGNYIRPISANTQAFFTAGTERMRITPGGNIGIGTSTPTQKLDVAGNIRIGEHRMIEGTAAYKVYRNLATFNNTSPSAAGAFAITTAQPWNSTCMFRVKIEGYFYDNTAPFEITVAGYIFNNNTFYNYGYINSGSKKLLVRLARNNTTNTVAVLLGDESANYSYPKISVVSFMQGHANINEAYADGWNITQETTLSNFSYIVTVPDVTTAPPSPGSGNYIQNQIASTQGANYWINGTGRAAQLQLNNTNTNLSQGGGNSLRVTTNSGFTEIGAQNTGWSHFQTDLPRFYFNKGITVDQGLIGSFSQDLSLQTSGTTRITALNSNGHVGIGTASPAERLHVAGNIRVGGNLAINSEGDHLKLMHGVRADDDSYEWVGFYSNTTRQGIILYDGPWGGANSLNNEFSLTAENNNLLTLNTSGNHIALMPKGAGYVGIGTVLPSHPLHVTKQVTGGWQSRFQNNASNVYLAHESGYGIHINTGQANSTGRYALEVRNASQTHLFVRDDGNTGLATTTPGFRFTIAGTGNIFGVDNQASFVARNASGNYENYFWPRWSDNIMYMNYGTGGMQVRNNASASTMFLTNGNFVGIGNSNPAYRLHTSGDIYADGGWFRVSGNQGLYFESHGGGFYMIDNSWIRTYGNKNFYHNTGVMRTDGTLQVGDSGGTLNVVNGGNMSYRTNVLMANTAGRVGVNTTNPLTTFDVYGVSYFGVDVNYHITAGSYVGLDPILHPSLNGIGYVGVSGSAWYRMYCYGYINASLREYKRNITPVSKQLSDYVMRDIDKLQPYFYKYKEETDKMEAGKESHYRPQMHLGLMVDESPDYLKDESFKGIDIYGVASLAIAGVKHNRAEISEIKKSAMSSLQDFGNAIMNGTELWINYSDEFKSRLSAGETPIIQLTPNQFVQLIVSEKNNHGFKVKTATAVNNLEIDWLALMKNKTLIESNDGGLKQISAEILHQLEVPEREKQLLTEYWNSQTESIGSRGKSPQKKP